MCKWGDMIWMGLCSWAGSFFSFYFSILYFSLLLYSLQSIQGSCTLAHFLWVLIPTIITGRHTAEILLSWFWATSRANMAIKQVTWMFWLPIAYKSYIHTILQSIKYAMAFCLKKQNPQKPMRRPWLKNPLYCGVLVVTQRVKSLTSIHEVAGSIPGLPQLGEDLPLAQVAQIPHCHSWGVGRQLQLPSNLP